MPVTATTPSTATSTISAGTTRIPPAETVAPGATILFRLHRQLRRAVRPVLARVADVPTLDFAKVNPVSGPIYRRRRRARRRAEGHDRELRAVRLRLDGEHPRLRAARRPVHRTGAACSGTTTRRRWRRRCSARDGRGAAEALRRHDRQRAGRAGPALRRPAAARRRQPRHPRPRRRDDALPAGRGRGRAVLASATPMRRRATARSAARRSRARWTSVLTLDLVKGANLKTPRFTTPGPVTRHLDAKGYEVTTGIGPDLMAGARDAVSPTDRPARRARHGMDAGRRLHARLGLRRPADLRDRRHAELGGVVLLPALRLRVTATARPARRPRPTRRRRRCWASRASPCPSTPRPACARSSRDLSFDSSRGETLCHRRRIRLGQVDDRAGDHGPAAASPAVRVTAGRIRLGGADLLDAAAKARMRDIRGDRIAMIFQEPMTSLNPVLTIGRQLIEAIEAHVPLGARRGARPRRRGAATPCASPSPSAAWPSIRTNSPAACASA